MTGTTDIAVGRATLHRLGGEEGLPDLLLIHGFGSDRFSWSATAPDFFRTHRVWAVELPGHTAAPIDAGAGDPKSMALAVINAIASLNPPIAVVGHSLGGAVAIEMAALQPDLILSLALIAPAGVADGTNADFLKAFPSLQTPDDAQPLLERLVARPKLISPQIVQYVLGFLNVPGRREALSRIAGCLAAISALGIPRDLTPTIIWGDLDAINNLPPGFAEKIGDRLHVLKGVGHMPHVEQARATNGIVRAAVMPDTA